MVTTGLAEMPMIGADRRIFSNRIVNLDIASHHPGDSCLVTYTFSVYLVVILFWVLFSRSVKCHFALYKTLILWQRS
jgi:hypothetical protein